MKKSILILLFLYSAILSIAQCKAEFGLESGPGSTFLRGKDFINQAHEPVLTFTGGFTFKYNFSKRVSLRTGISYERKGSRIHGVFLDPFGRSSEFTIRNDFHYISLPLLVRLSFGQRIQGFVNAGPYASYLLSQIPVYTEGQPVSNDPIRAQTENFNPFDFGISVGAGASFPISERLSLSLEMRNNLGLSNISAIPIINNGTIKTNATFLLIGLSYKFFFPAMRRLS